MDKYKKGCTVKLTEIPLLFAEDADPFEGRGFTDLEKHDRRFHPNGYKEGDSCRYRDALKRGDRADDLAAAEKAEGDAAEAVKKIIDRYNAVGVLIMAQPLSEDPYQKVFALYGISKGDKEFASALGILQDAQEWFEAEEVDEKDPGDVTNLRRKVLDVDDALLALKNPQKQGAQPAQKKVNATKPAQVKRQDYDDLMEIRNILERVARLLNGRTGNIQALQASSRWPALVAVSRNRALGTRLDELSQSKDTELSSAARSLSSVLDSIVKSSTSNWNLPAGTVMPASALPTFKDGTPEE